MVIRSSAGKTLAELWGHNIRLQREMRKRPDGTPMPQTELAEIVGVTQSVVSQWEKGRCAPSSVNQMRIARALGVDARLLFPYPQEVA